MSNERRLRALTEASQPAWIEGSEISDEEASGEGERELSRLPRPLGLRMSSSNSVDNGLGFGEQFEKVKLLRRMLVVAGVPGVDTVRMRVRTLSSLVTRLMIDDDVDDEDCLCLSSGAGPWTAGDAMPRAGRERRRGRNPGIIYDCLLVVGVVVVTVVVVVAVEDSSGKRNDARGLYKIILLCSLACLLSSYFICYGDASYLSITWNYGKDDDDDDHCES
jgi:hypothetical protein